MMWELGCYFVIVVTSLFLNGFAVFVFLRPAMRKCGYNSYLLLLCISSFALVFFVLLVHLENLQQMPKIVARPVACEITTMLTHWMSNLISCSILAFTAERCFVVCYPLRRNCCTVKVSACAVSVMTILIGLFSTPMLFISRTRIVGRHAMNVSQFVTEGWQSVDKDDYIEDRYPWEQIQPFVELTPSDYFPPEKETLMKLNIFRPYNGSFSEDRQPILTVIACDIGVEFGWTYQFIALVDLIISFLIPFVGISVMNGVILYKYYQTLKPKKMGNTEKSHPRNSAITTTIGVTIATAVTYYHSTAGVFGKKEETNTNGTSGPINQLSITIETSPDYGSNNKADVSLHEGCTEGIQLFKVESTTSIDSCIGNNHQSMRERSTALSNTKKLSNITESTTDGGDVQHVATLLDHDQHDEMPRFRFTSGEPSITATTTSMNTLTTNAFSVTGMEGRCDSDITRVSRYHGDDRFRSRSFSSSQYRHRTESLDSQTVRKHQGGLKQQKPVKIPKILPTLIMLSLSFFVFNTPFYTFRFIDIYFLHFLEDASVSEHHNRLRTYAQLIYYLQFSFTVVIYTASHRRFRREIIVVLSTVCPFLSKRLNESRTKAGKFSTWHQSVETNKYNSILDNSKHPSTVFGPRSPLNERRSAASHATTINTPLLCSNPYQFPTRTRIRRRSSTY